MTSIGIAIMYHTAAWTTPYSYAQLTQSTRPACSKTGRASQAGPRFVDFAIVHAKPFGFVCKHGTKLAPSSIKHGFCHRGFGQFGGGDIANRNQASVFDNRRRSLVCPVLTLKGYLGVNNSHQPTVWCELATAEAYRDGGATHSRTALRSRETRLTACLPVSDYERRAG